VTTPAAALDAYADSLVPLAARLVGAVHTRDLAGIRRLYADLRRHPRLPGVHPAETLAMVCAAMVDDARPISDLLQWINGPAGLDRTAAEAAEGEAA